MRVIDPGEEELWAKVVARGWQEEAPELVQYLEDLAPIEAQRADTYSFLAEKETEPIAAAAMCVFDGVALLAGACTVPEYRRQAPDLRFLERRLQFGAEQGCDLAMMAAAPGSASQRNAERQGFRIAYTRIKWRLCREKGKD